MGLVIWSKTVGKGTRDIEIYIALGSQRETISYILFVSISIDMQYDLMTSYVSSWVCFGGALHDKYWVSYWIKIELTLSW
jgi:hypothetical protein